MAVVKLIFPDGTTVDYTYSAGNVIPADFTGYTIDAYGTKRWFKDGKKHRDGDEPTFISVDGSKLWFKEDISHRDRGLPSDIYCCGLKLWHVNGIETGRWFVYL
jgi:hypothetical protein